MILIPKLLTVLGCLLLSVPVAFAQTKAPLRITVDKDQKTKQSVTQAQARSYGNVTYLSPQVLERNREMIVNIKTLNLGATEMSGLKLKYIVFGRDKETGELRSATEGEEKVDIKPLEIKTVKTKPVQFESQDRTYTQGTFSELNRRSGAEYYGIAVIVFNGDDKIASFYNPVSLEKALDKLEQRSK